MLSFFSPSHRNRSAHQERTISPTGPGDRRLLSQIKKGSLVRSRSLPDLSWSDQDGSAALPQGESPAQRELFTDSPIRRAPRELLTNSSAALNVTSVSGISVTSTDRTNDDNRILDHFLDDNSIRFQESKCRLGAKTSANLHKIAIFEAQNARNQIEDTATLRKVGKINVEPKKSDDANRKKRERERKKAERIARLAVPVCTERQKRAEEEVKKREVEELSKCTFKPKLIAKFNRDSMVPPSSTRRREYLQDLLEKERRECTFRPKLVSKFSPNKEPTSAPSPPNQPLTNSPDVPRKKFGVGILVRTTTGRKYPTIRRLLEDGCSASCPEMAIDDELLEVDGVSCAYKGVADMIKLFLGDEGSSVVVVGRSSNESSGHNYTVTLTRGTRRESTAAELESEMESKPPISTIPVQDRIRKRRPSVCPKPLNTATTIMQQVCYTLSTWCLLSTWRPP